MRTLACIGLLALASTASAAGKDVALKAADGTVLKASYFSPGKPGPGVVLLHMCNSQRTAWAGLGEKLAAKGLHVIALDYRGYGESGGVHFDKVPREERQRIVAQLWPGDIDLAFQHLIAQPGVDREHIGAAGGSCGVNEAIQLARRHPEVKTVVMLSGTTDAAGEEYLARSPWLPILAAAAHDDGGAVEATKWTMDFSSSGMKDFKEYQTGGHGTDLFATHPELETAIVAWFERHLVTQPVRATAGPPRPGPSAQLAAKLREPGGAARALAEVRAARKLGAPLNLPPERAINALAYQQLRDGRQKEAIELFTLNVEAFPDSANTYDSLSEAYLAAKDRARAVEYARKAIDALARDKKAPEELKKQIREAAEQTIRGDAK